ncbi:DUF4157 domain-containing protein [Flavobacterium sp. HTF]|uniref:eCIS core domain-containing protein n=1 Tax=Flavobacterium sp. HTF TaxID=2170732 RepID=UPI000D5D4CE6|nr:DUF4157 domain-containing protein [Flavobacterium sp. HTF]PWB24991.1 peptidoglycan-binding protein [Flavobacterium sp. HTF]
MRAFEQRKRNIPDNTTVFFGPKIQKKLKTGSVGDKYEVEADNVADKVVNHNPSSGGLLQSKEQVQQKPVSETISTVQSKEMKEEDKSVQKKPDKEEDKKVQKKSDKKEEDKTVQKKCTDCEKEEKVQKKEEKEEEKPVQKKAQNSETEIQNNELEGKLDSSKGGGTGLDKKTKREMESGFGNDFSNVKIHTDSSAVQMSQELGAQAFTNGNDVYFNEGKYNPGSKEGKHLLAHELTHTVQQTGAVQKSIDPNASASEDLEAARFQGEYRLEQAHDNLDYLAVGSKGEPVQKVQSGLLDLGYSLPKFGADGDYGSETKAAVLNFQSDNDLAYDGVVGIQTIGRLDDIYAGKDKGKNKKPPKKKDCDIFNRFKFSSEPTHIEPLKATKDCKSFSITLTTKRNKNENPCSTYSVTITDSNGAVVRGPMSVGIGGTFPFNFTALKVDTFNMIIATPQSCGENAFTGKGTKHRQ